MQWFSGSVVTILTVIVPTGDVSHTFHWHLWQSWDLQILKSCWWLRKLMSVINKILEPWPNFIKLFNRKYFLNFFVTTIPKQLILADNLFLLKQCFSSMLSIFCVLTGFIKLGTDCYCGGTCTVHGNLTGTLILLSNMFLLLNQNCVHTYYIFDVDMCNSVFHCETCFNNINHFCIELNLM